ncbi:MAG: hypothetical protein FJX54_08260 [Alphaproteobacteria bacterium]|nr:hypothetical protein [Alphaproteobacteria bacterium]
MSGDARRRLALEPANAAWPLRCAEDAMARGDGDSAALWLGAAAALSPTMPALAAPLRTIALAYLSAGHPARAALMLRRAIAAGPDDWRGWNDLAAVEDRRISAEEGLRLSRVAAVLAPDVATVLCNHADLLFRTGAADAALRVALRVPADADAATIAGNSALRLSRLDLATRRFRGALCLSPSSPPALIGFAVARMTDEDMAGAGRWLHRARAVDPSDVGLNNNLATWHLVQGDYRRGFALYEWRWRRPEAVPRRQGLPEWNGEPVRGRRLLLYQEQGLGDVLQMVRYVPLLAEMGARVVIQCQPPLHRLLRSLRGDPLLVGEGTAVEADVQVPLLSLPRLLGTDLDSIPGSGGYLSADKNLVAATASLVSAPTPRIGLVWQGNPRQNDEPYRSIPLAALAPLLEIPDASFYGLQRDHGRDQMKTLPSGRLVDLGPRLDDLATTAAILMHLDLVITTCTAMAHLAGALGRPVWVLLKRGADWRWMLDRSDSPWYPTARLFRQPRLGDWESVAKQVTDSVRASIR